MALTACGAVARGTSTPPVAALRIASGTVPTLANGAVVFVWVCFRSRASQKSRESSRSTHERKRGGVISVQARVRCGAIAARFQTVLTPPIILAKESKTR